MNADLHIHSTASDGTETPSAIVAQAHRLNLNVIALTDHDTVAGIREAERAASLSGIRFIPGIELSSGAEQEIHVLGYGIKPEIIAPALTDSSEERRLRICRIISLLQEKGIPIDIEQVESIANGAPLGRPHVARALVELNYASSVKRAFDRYIGDGRPCFVARKKMTFQNAVRLIHDAGGIAIIAHPVQIRCPRRMLTQMFDELIRLGADGLEAWHSSHSLQDSLELDSYARKRHLLITGGSDYHGSISPVKLGEKTDQWQHAEEDINNLFQAMED